MKKISKIFAASLLLVSLTGCYEDKGNYTYSEIEEVTVTFPSNISAMQGTEYIEFDPEVVSSINGPISADNPDYAFDCKLYKSYTDEYGVSQRWTPMDPEGTKAVKFFADFSAGNYYFWYTVTNKKTDVTFNFKGNCSVISTTSEGWMVLSNDGSDKHVRLDLIFEDSKGVEHVRQDLFDDNAPVMHDAKKLVLSPTLYSTGDQIALITGEGSQFLHPQTMQFMAAGNIKLSDFVLSTTPGEIVNWSQIFNNSWISPLTKTCVTDLGNVYGVTSSGAGAAFEYPMNTDVPGNPATYQVSEFIGTGQSRPGNSYGALYYDITNKRFVGWYRYASEPRLLNVLRDPENAKFSFQTGMDIVYMEGTAFNNIVWSVLQDASGKRYLYGIIVEGATADFPQEGRYEINAPDFDTADDYTFHPRTGLMFYSKDNKIYCYSIYNARLLDTLTLEAGEKVTMIKFNNIQNMTPENVNHWEGKLELDRYRLIVGSTTGAENGGVVRFYDVDDLGTGKMTLNREYTGFGQEIVDVTYRERRK